MTYNTKIEWTEATWNPITGCTVTSPGCTNCYAMKLAGTRLQHHPSRAGLTRMTKAGPVWTGEVRLNEQWLTQPLKWKRPRRIFVCAHGDLFHESVPDEWIDRVFAVMALAPQHTYQVLTKRSARMLTYCNDPVTKERVAEIVLERWINGEMTALRTLSTLVNRPAPEDSERVNWPLPNVWLGVSVEDQARADERIPDLLATPAAVRWLSCEPLLGPVDLGMIHHDGITNIDSLRGHHGVSGMTGDCAKLDWIVVGGESGPGARPMHPDLAFSLRDQCADTGVPFFFKQWGSWCPAPGRRPWSEPDDPHVRDFGDGYVALNVGKARAGRMLDGLTHDAMPVTPA